METSFKPIVDKIIDGDTKTLEILKYMPSESLFYGLTSDIEARDKTEINNENYVELWKYFLKKPENVAIAKNYLEENKFSKLKNILNLIENAR